MLIFCFWTTPDLLAIPDCFQWLFLVMLRGSCSARDHSSPNLLTYEACDQPIDHIVAQDNLIGGRGTYCLSKISFETVTFFDLQDDYMEALTRLHITVSKAYKVNPDMNFEVFIHKVDGLSDDHKIETQRDIHQRANDDLADAGLEKLHLR